jgi:hypothetical protein
MITRIAPFAAALCLLTLSACVTSGAGSSTGSNSDELTRADLQEFGMNGNMYDAVNRMRSQWLRSRGSRGLSSGDPTPLLVYVDGNKRGGVSALRTISVNRVEFAEYVRPSRANTRFGAGTAGGVISVEMRDR